MKHEADIRRRPEQSRRCIAAAMDVGVPNRLRIAGTDGAGRHRAPPGVDCHGDVSRMLKTEPESLPVHPANLKLKPSIVVAIS